VDVGRILVGTVCLCESFTQRVRDRQLMQSYISLHFMHARTYLLTSESEWLIVYVCYTGGNWTYPWMICLLHGCAYERLKIKSKSRRMCIDGARSR